jgi:hypothetical protein
MVVAARFNLSLYGTANLDNILACYIPANIIFVLHVSQLLKVSIQEGPDPRGCAVRNFGDF